MRSADRRSAAWTLPQSPYSRHTQLHASPSDRLGTAGCSRRRVGTLRTENARHLGSGRATYGYQVNDAYAVHDQMLWLPIGLAYAH